MKRLAGRLAVPGGEIWYEVVGEGPRPLVTLHGGPGWPSDSLRPLDALATERPVVFYDQLGCGRSDRPDDPALWTVERSVEELRLLVESLDVPIVDLFGHSWGTMLAVDFTLAHPDPVGALVLSSPSLSARRWIADCNRLIAALPPEVAAIHGDPTASDEDVARLDAEFSRRHFCRLDPRPPDLQAAQAGFGLQVYHTMWGPSEFRATGNLAGYDRTARLGELAGPILFTCGRHDEATPESTAYYAALAGGAEVVVFEDSAHVAMHEETDRFLDVVGSFLRR